MLPLGVIVAEPATDGEGAAEAANFVMCFGMEEASFGESGGRYGYRGRKFGKGFEAARNLAPMGVVG